MNQDQIIEKLSSEFGEDVIKDTLEFRDQLAVIVDAEKIVDVCRYLKEERYLAFDILSFVGAVDRYPASPRFEVVYQLLSTRHNHRFRLKALLEETPDQTAAIDSVTSLWPTADWHERETAEFFGITFNNHPDPRKLLLPEEWTVRPLRKDFSVEGNDQDTPDLPA